MMVSHHLRKMRLMNNYSVKYGDSIITLKSDREIQQIESQILTTPALDTEKALTQSLNLAKPDIGDYLAGGKKLLMVIPDRTRKCGLEVILPILLQRIESYGYNEENIVFLIANGIHPLCDPNIYSDIVGKAVYQRYKFIQHDCDASSISLGSTRRGTPVKINPLITEFDRIIAVSGVLPHFFAVYGGGPKLILPGCSSRETITANHRLSLNLDPHWRPGDASPALADNELITDIMEAVSFLPEIFYIGLILGFDNAPRKIVSGEIISTYKKLAESAEQLFTVSGKRDADMVIVSPGGFPKDIDLLQTHKSMFHASAALKDGGEMIVFAECRNGIGSKNLEYLLNLQSLKAVRDDLSRQYLINGQTAISLLKMAELFDVKTISAMDESLINKLGFSRIDDNMVEEVIADCSGSKIYFFPAASITKFIV